MPDISDTITQAPKSVYKNAWGAKLTANFGYAQGNVNTLTSDGKLLLYTRIGKRVAGYVEGGLTIKSKDDTIYQEQERGAFRFDVGIVGFARRWCLSATGMATVVRDTQRKIDIRATGGGGPWLDYNFKEKFMNGLSVFILGEGTQLQDERIKGLARLSIRNLMTFNISNTVTGTIDALYAPNVQDFADFRIWLSASIAVKLVKRGILQGLSLTCGVNFTHESRTAPEVKKDDVALTCGLSVELGPKKKPKKESKKKSKPAQPRKSPPPTKEPPATPPRKKQLI